MIDFPTFFKAIHGYHPFPWQAMLAEQVLQRGRWPRLIDLPTASGKTACIDIAVWATAQEAEKNPHDRTMPRRIWFVVDRRIVVDEAAERAEKIQEALIGDSNLTKVADALRQLSGTTLPLAVDRLRGGGKPKAANADLPNDAWQQVPCQPAVLTSTVDQVGSRLLFRGYGMSPGMWPIHAALAGNDSLILLDEAHIAEPLRQTLAWIERYRQQADEPVATPWHVAFMTATPGAVDEGNAWPLFPTAGEKGEALQHDLLDQRREAAKRATLETIPGDKRDDKKLAEAALGHVHTLLGDGRRRVAVMLNRVDTALATERLLTEKLGDCGVDLLTGRMRPIDRERLIEDLGQVFAANRDRDRESEGPPRVLVTTQCLEVGADFDFDALVTECASLDALRQRFGRLDRLGTRGRSPAVVLACAAELASTDGDPIYGPALARTWAWLNGVAEEGTVVDFGIRALEANLAEYPPEGGVTALLSPKPDAPVLLPAYLDAWCQTGPRPAAEAEVSLFLHGPHEESAEVQVVFRTDLPDHLDIAAVAEIVRLCPPAPAERLPVRLGRLRAWLGGKKLPADADVDAVGDDTPKAKDPLPSRLVRYRGGRSEEVEVLPIDARLRPGDVLILPIGGNDLPEALGTKPAEAALDRFEDANDAKGSRRIIRLTAATPSPRPDPQRDAEVAAECVRIINRGPDEVEQDDDEDVKARALDRLRGLIPDEWPKLELPSPCNGIEYHVHRAGGAIIVGPKPKKAPPVDPFGEADDLLNDVRDTPGHCRKLDYHQRRVAQFATAFADRCAPLHLAAIAEAARHHDDGKADPRFQGLLHRSPAPIVLKTETEMLAKSEARPTPGQERWLRRQLGLPDPFRHEMLSLQLVQKRRPDAGDLLLHLLASHHGAARPLAPVSVDESPWDVALADDVTLTADERAASPPHRLGSGVAERFWRLTRCHGWWGLAYLEAVLRLADQHASRFPEDKQDSQKMEAADA